MTERCEHKGTGTPLNKILEQFERNVMNSSFKILEQFERNVMNSTFDVHPLIDANHSL